MNDADTALVGWGEKPSLAMLSLGCGGTSAVCGAEANTDSIGWLRKGENAASEPYEQALLESSAALADRTCGYCLLTRRLYANDTLCC